MHRSAEEVILKRGAKIVICRQGKLLNKIGFSFGKLHCYVRHACDPAAASGYSSLEYFFAVFKKHFDLTPGEYRRSKAKALSHPDVNTDSILF